MPSDTICPMRIEGKTALITGGASGLGAASARMIVEAGGRVVIADLKSGLDLGASAVFVPTDVTDTVAMQAAVTMAVERFGALHILMNCAGIGLAARVVSKDGPMPLDRFTRIIGVNLIGSFNALRLAAVAMMKNSLDNSPDEDGERGVIVNTASVAAFE